MPSRKWMLKGERDAMRDAMRDAYVKTDDDDFYPIRIRDAVHTYNPEETIRETGYQYVRFLNDRMERLREQVGGKRALSSPTSVANDIIAALRGLMSHRNVRQHIGPDLENIINKTQRAVEEVGDHDFAGVLEVMEKYMAKDVNKLIGELPDTPMLPIDEDELIDQVNAISWMKWIGGNEVAVSTHNLGSGDVLMSFFNKRGYVIQIEDLHVQDYMNEFSSTANIISYEVAPEYT